MSEVNERLRSLPTWGELDGLSPKEIANALGLDYYEQDPPYADPDFIDRIQPIDGKNLALAIAAAAKKDSPNG